MRLTSEVVHHMSPLPLAWSITYPGFTCGAFKLGTHGRTRAPARAHTCTHLGIPFEEADDPPEGLGFSFVGFSL